MIYLQLFFSFLQVGLFSFGGGYAAMPLIQEQIVTKHGWLSMVEFTDLSLKHKSLEEIFILESKNKESEK